nr:hypothetical protein CFP56_20465 [Quercus suber]
MARPGNADLDFGASYENRVRADKWNTFVFENRSSGGGCSLEVMHTARTSNAISRPRGPQCKTLNLPSPRVAVFAPLTKSQLVENVRFVEAVFDDPSLRCRLHRDVKGRHIIVQHSGGAGLAQVPWLGEHKQTVATLLSHNSASR